MRKGVSGLEGDVWIRFCCQTGSEEDNREGKEGLKMYPTKTR